ncbi:MAG: Site-specific recombinase XerD [Candidatus Nitrotoga sp. CP45]|nr:MAG: Site-specific recombinase XerD [Candidatus Nitrotoga sp. CP45]
MSLYKRNDSSVWWVKLHHSGKIIQRSTGTADKVKAQEYHDKLKSSLWEQERLGVKPSYSWQQAVVRWLEETTHKSSRIDDLYHLRQLDKYLGGFNLVDISRDKVESIITIRLKDGVSNGRVNRMLSVLRTILRKAAFDWEWIDRCPRVKILPEPKRRVRWLIHAEAERLISELPVHLAGMVRFSLETGLRQANVTGLQWSQVDLVRRCAWIHPDQAKARKAIAVPLSSAAVLVLREWIGKHQTHVFSFRNKPVMQPNNAAWNKALKRAGIDDFRWHDLRHTWASWHVQAGTPLHVLQELGGWESAEMVRRYAHLSSEHLAEYVDRLSGLKLVGGYDVATVLVTQES